MEAQDYFKEQLEVVEIYTKELSDLGKEFGEIMLEKGYGTDEEVANGIKNGELTDSEMDLYYKFGITSVDYKAQRSKLLDFVYFCNVLGIKLDISDIKNTKGLLELSKEYIPYKTYNIITPEKKVKVENMDYYNNMKKEFIKNLVVRK